MNITLQQILTPTVLKGKCVGISSPSADGRSGGAK